MVQIGNLREFEMNRKELTMRLEDPCMRVIMIGMMQGIFEMAFDIESNVEWNLSDDGDLKVEIKPNA